MLFIKNMRMSNMKKQSMRFFFGIMIATIVPLFAQESPVDPVLAHQYFAEMQANGEKDGGVLWGVRLNGPMLFVDPQTRSLAANMPDKEGLLSKQGEVYTGKLPTDKIIANTSITWAGVKWTMVMWPLPKDKYNRGRLMAHESFHRVQDEIGLPMTSPSNAHLSTGDGRLWMRLEWRALKTALTSSGDARRTAVEHALTFRIYRQSLFPNAAEDERSLEMNEGLSEYTGFKLCGLSDSATVAYAAEYLDRSEKRDSYVRSFAYASGPAYGLLLDAAGMNWRKGLTADNDPGILLQKAYGVKIPAVSDELAILRAAHYEYDVLFTTETERESVLKKRVADYKARLVDGPVLIIALQSANCEFDPNTVQPIGDLGTVYPSTRFVDVWGVLTVETGGALVSSNWSSIRVSASKISTDGGITGEGWKLELNQGWKIDRAERNGDWTVKKAD